MVRDHGYRRAGPAAGNGDGHAGNGPDNGDTRVDWGSLYENIRIGRDYHDSLLQLSCMLVAAGTDAGAVVNQLRDLMDRSAAPHDERWQARYDDIPRLVRDAKKKVGEGKGTSEDLDVEIARLAKLSLLEYEQQRKVTADEWDIRASILDKLVMCRAVSVTAMSRACSGCSPRPPLH